MSHFNVRKYLRRIKYKGRLLVDASTLRALHYAHLGEVPFESLDISIGRPVSLNRDTIYEKIVQRSRGGYCYELNGCFAQLLRELGFSVQLLPAQALDPEGQYGPPMEHMTLLVSLEKQWLVDVGFQDPFLYPLPLEDDTPQPQGEYFYTIQGNEVVRKRMNASPNEMWRTLYRFDKTPKLLRDFSEMNTYHQTSLESFFQSHRLVTRSTEACRQTLLDNRFIVAFEGEKSERLITSTEEYNRILQNVFNIEFKLKDL